MNNNEYKYLNKLMDTITINDNNDSVVRILCEDPIDTIVSCRVHSLDSDCTNCPRTGNCAIELIAYMPDTLDPNEASNVIEALRDKIIAIPRPDSRN